jgi:hypothetical protein
MMSMLCNCGVRELLILARTWFAFGLPSKTGCDNFFTPELMFLSIWLVRDGVLGILIAKTTRNVTRANFPFRYILDSSFTNVF